MFYLTYVTSELRRRMGRTLLTALGLGVGVGLVVAVSALSQGLNDAQDEVLEPLTGVGTDMSVSRPLRVGNRSGSGGGFGGQNLSGKERDQLEKENGGARLNLDSAGKAGERFTRTNFLSTQQLSFPASEVAEIEGQDGVQAAAGSLTLSAITISGKVPSGGFQTGGGAGPPGGGGGGGNPPQNINFKSLTVTGVDQSKSSLAAVTPSQIQKGSYLSDDDSRQAVVNVSYAQRNDLDVGEGLTLKNKRYTIVGLSRSPLGGQASDVYVKLGQLQKASGREGRVNTVQVRADSANDVGKVQKEIRAGFAGSSVTTSADLAERVGGSLTDAKNLSDKLGVALTIVALVAAFLIASLLTLSSVTKRIRELGTLKAIGWPQGKVVRQVTGESLAQGALGGVIGALIGVAAAVLINAIGITLKATVAGQSTGGAGFGPPGGGGAFGQGSVTSGSTEVALKAPVDLGLIVLAISLALLGGLVAGSVGGLRAARALDRPTEGEVRFEDADLRGRSDGALARLRRDTLGFVFQQFNLIPTLTAEQNIEVAMAPTGRPGGERHARSRALLERVGLGHRLGNLPTQLSGGEQQRVAIARALANDPRVVLADEPTGNLDTATGEEIMAILRELNDAGLTIVLITHDPSIAGTARRLIRMRDGRLLAAAERDEGAAPAVAEQGGGR